MVNVNTRTFIYFASSISQSFFSSISPTSISQSFLGLFREVIPSDSTLHFSKFSISQTEDILQVLLFRQVLRREKPVCKIVKLAKSKTCKMSSVCEIGSTQGRTMSVVKSASLSTSQPTKSQYWTYIYSNEMKIGVHYRNWLQLISDSALIVAFHWVRDSMQVSAWWEAKKVK